MLVHSEKRQFVRNAVLASLSLEDLAEIGRLFEPIVLRERMVLQEPKKPADYVYFIESGLVSQRIVAAGSILEVAVIGYHGAVGACRLLGRHLPTHQFVVLFPGCALRVHVDDLRRVMSERPRIRERLSQYVQALVLHGAQTGLCGVWHDREQRLACWLCLVCDAVDGHVHPVTHGYLSAVLGFRRSGVTETLIRFEEEGLIGKTRGVLKVIDRERLQQKACSCYRFLSSAYASSEQSRSMEQQALQGVMDLESILA